VLIDGVRIGAATAGLPELEALSLASIERIEVLRGPGSSLYGADAVGGVVQIFTRRGSGPLRSCRAMPRRAAGHARGLVAAGSGASAVDLAAGVSASATPVCRPCARATLFGNHNPDATAIRGAARRRRSAGRRPTASGCRCRCWMRC
jgi:vitamin B12 transporter